MAERSPLHQQELKSGEVEPSALAPQVKKLPLLPYEKQLIELLGCSEEEYRFFATEAAKRGKTRPAAYDHVPDVQNGPATPILINLAIGLALTAVSMLLAPS